MIVKLPKNFELLRIQDEMRLQSSIWDAQQTEAGLRQVELDQAKQKAETFQRLNELLLMRAEDAAAARLNVQHSTKEALVQALMDNSFSSTYRIEIENPVTVGTWVTPYTRYTVVVYRTSELRQQQLRGMSESSDLSMITKVYRRYSDFEWFHQWISNQLGQTVLLPCLPSKHLLKLDEQLVTERMAQLQAYLQACLVCPRVCQMSEFSMLLFDTTEEFQFVQENHHQDPARTKPVASVSRLKHGKSRKSWTTSAVSVLSLGASKIYTNVWSSGSTSSTEPVQKTTSSPKKKKTIESILSEKEHQLLIVAQWKETLVETRTLIDMYDQVIREGQYCQRRHRKYLGSFESWILKLEDMCVQTQKPEVMEALVDQSHALWKVKHERLDAHARAQESGMLEALTCEAMFLKGAEDMMTKFIMLHESWLERAEELLLESEPPQVQNGGLPKEVSSVSTTVSVDELSRWTERVHVMHQALTREYTELQRNTRPCRLVSKVVTAAQCELDLAREKRLFWTTLLTEFSK